MNKTLVILLALSILINVSSCGIAKNDSGNINDTSDNYLDNQSNMVQGAKRETQHKLDKSLQDVTREVLGSFDSAHSNVNEKFTADKDSNEQIGILDYKYISNQKFEAEGNSINHWLTMNICILETDMESEEYKNLKPGDNICYVVDGAENYMSVTAINKQFVLCIYVEEGHDTTITDYKETQPDFSYEDAQNAYKAFIKIS